MDYTIRNVTTEDLDGVTNVEAICFPAAEAADRRALADRIAAFPDSFFVAEADGNIIGFINGAVTDSQVIEDVMFEEVSLHKPEGAYQSIFGLDVLPDFRGRGIAADLMRHMIKEAKNQGRKGLILTCKEGLIHYYEAFGYRSLGLSESVHGGAVWYDMILDL